MKTINQINLNLMELQVLKAIIENAEDCSGGSFACSDEIHQYTKIKGKELSGYISSLQKKGWIRCWDNSGDNRDTNGRLVGQRIPDQITIEKELPEQYKLVDELKPAPVVDRKARVQRQVELSMPHGLKVSLLDKAEKVAADNLREDGIIYIAISHLDGSVRLLMDPDYKPEPKKKAPAKKARKPRQKKEKAPVQTITEIAAGKVLNYANRMGWSDVEPYEIIERRTPRKVIIRAMNSELDPSWKPEMVAGGFAGHCTNQASQKWIITSNPVMPPIAIRLNKQGWQDKHGNRYNLSDAPSKYYDYNF